MAVCVQIDYFAMNLALPRMASELNSNATDLQWVISVYMLTSLVTLAGVGVAVSGTALEMLQRGGMSAAVRLT